MKDYLAHFLLNATVKQISQAIKSLNKKQLEWLIEIIYNVMQGVCSISSVDKTLLTKKRKLIRKIVSKGVAYKQRKLYLLKIRGLLPIFLKTYLRYVSRTDSDP